ncbi:hypothetical protein CBR_g11165 [Chara braunii]|uniref:Uncharacterized protein n=1 Tax=Chara braunii TaxID=69332 RepID=A0A388KQA8_CHABU|nr:hypothetical protein CBR_g11165 [Chara braunii]|eukprot:GBG72235.1 hypothetical protein CBR_g11165 [Chara braunii]
MDIGRVERRWVQHCAREKRIFPPGNFVLGLRRDTWRIAAGLKKSCGGERSPGSHITNAVHSHHGLATGSDFRYSRAEEEAEEESEGELRREVGEAAARLAEDEEEEREAAEESAEAEEEEEEEAGEETSEEEEEAYSEHNEGEPSEEEYEDDDEEVESGDDQEPTRDDELEWVPGPDRREGSPEAAAQRKKEVAEGKRSAIDPPLNDSSKDLELPKPEHGNLAAMTSNVVTTRRRPRS